MLRLFLFFIIPIGLVISSIFIPWIWFITVPYVTMLLLKDRSRRRDKYYMEAVIWDTGGAFRTGDIDHDKAKILFKKACRLSHFDSCYALSEIYKNENNAMHVAFSDRAMRIDPMKFKDFQERDRVADEKFARDFKAEIHQSRINPNHDNSMYNVPDAWKVKSDK